MLIEYVRLLVVNLHQRCALMCLEEEWGEWDLPYYSCLSGNVETFVPYVSQLYKDLKLDETQPRFTGITDILGDYPVYGRGCGTSKPGYSRLLLVETHDYSFDLPEGWEWKDAEFLESLEDSEKCDDCGLEASMRRAVLVLNKSDAIMDLLWQPRHRFGWYGRASSWLRQVVEEQGAEVTGPVVQHSVNAWTTILRVESSEGVFFLKSPTAGTPETQITRALHKVLPDMTLDVIGVSEELASFVSTEIEVACNRECDEHELRSMMTKQVGSFQLASIKHKDAPIEAGCVVLEPCKMHQLLDELQDDEFLQGCVVGFLDLADEFAPKIKSMLTRLVEGGYKIPLTVTHGDFARRNVGFRKDEAGNERMILFDWQYAVISHRFFDFLELKKKLDDGQIEEYLEMWTEYEPLERCWEAFELAYPLGWLLKIYTSLNCLRVSKTEEKPVMVTHLTEFWFTLELAIRRCDVYKDGEAEADDGNEEGN